MEQPEPVQTQFVSDAFQSEENYVDPIQQPTPVAPITNKVWGLQIKIWSILLLLFGLAHIPFIFIGVAPAGGGSGSGGMEVVFKFHWENLLSAILTIPTAFFGIFGGFRENILSLKIFIAGLIIVIMGRIATSIAILIIQISYGFLIPGIIGAIASLICCSFPCLLCGLCAIKNISSIQAEQMMTDEQYANLDDEGGNKFS